MVLTPANDASPVTDLILRRTRFWTLRRKVQQYKYTATQQISHMYVNILFSFSLSISFPGNPSEHSRSCKQSEQCVQCSVFYAENPFYIPLYHVSTVCSSEWKQPRGVSVNVICLILFSHSTDEEMYAVIYKGLALSLSLWTRSTLRQGKERFAWEDDDRIMHPPVDLGGSKHSSTIRVISVQAGTPLHSARLEVKPCSRFFPVSRTQKVASLNT
jgi:hypothetical protein